ncbi:KGG domain-containing protein [Pseudomonas sp. GL-RE-19]|uniref:KGG domain-containing protein n=1 Tax=Pseudomonas sp. GL-RE-19 TaxID=2832389 RepID=UPI001CBC32F6|nr:KGG domain-containing protein [Pseudomonas sp. GL-RE-19]
MANTGNNNPGNFGNDRDKASDAGKKGSGAAGGNHANDPQRASDMGQKGGQASGGQGSRDADRMSGGGQGIHEQFPAGVQVFWQGKEDLASGKYCEP